jgi:DNA-directed RNA polymerase sigma subunit (sigma70/sigma32)
VREKYNRISRFKNNLEHKLQREPTDEELSAELGCSVEEIGALLSNQALKQTVSLDAPVSRTDKNYRLLDSLDNGDDSEQEQIIKNIDEAKTLNLIFNSHYISKTEKYILSLRYGVWSEDLVGTSVEFKNGTEIKYEELSELISSGESTLDTVGQLFGVTRERIRQIQKKAERKIYKSYRHAKNA